jgi:hypothetical protein
MKGDTIMEKLAHNSIIVAVIFLVFSGSGIGSIIYVDGSAAGNEDGSSWSDAYTQLQSALAVASSGDEIRAAQGVFKPTSAAGDRLATFQLINGVAVQGGYAGLGAPNPDLRDVSLYETVLSGDLNNDDSPGFTNINENSYHVVTGSGTDKTAVLDGVTVTGGNANGLSEHVRGGGMYNSFGSPTIIHCVFIKNYAMVMGGGMFNIESCPTIIDCAFVDNVSDDDGGGIRNYLNSHAVITNCDFIGNSAFEEGGGLNNRKNSNAVVTGCIFIGNSARAGGGMENHVGKATVTGVLVISNCLFIGNVSPEGGGMRNNDANPIVTNCTFVGNSGSGMNNRKNAPLVTNCVFWSNSGGSFDGSGNPTVTFSDVEGGFSGIGNINVNPNFVQSGHWDETGVWAEGDYHLAAGSPCIDAGDSDYLIDPNETGIEGHPRIISGRVDMGAYEYQGSSEPDYTPPTPDPMAWESPPYATGSFSVAMEAAVAWDISGVEYYFECTFGSGHDSGWQYSPFFEDAGLNPDTEYTYQVKARDRSVSKNETAYSSGASVRTDPVCIASTMHVGSVVCEILSGSRGRKYGAVTVTVLDDCGQPVPGVQIYGEFTGDYEETGFGSTDTSGVAVITTQTQTKKPSYSFCVTGLTDGTLSYAPGDNLETCDKN